MGLIFPYQNFHATAPFLFKIGEGANGKNDNFGATVWFLLSLNGCDHSLFETVAQLGDYAVISILILLKPHCRLVLSYF